jgi:HD-like signal output (HDOD) protein
MSLLEPMVVHIRDVATAEIAVLVGIQEFIYRDPELVARLVQTAEQAAKTEG